MQSSTGDFQAASTSYVASEGSGQWTDLDHPDFYYEPGFKAHCEDRLAELAKLKPNWDRDNAPAIRADILFATRHFIAALPEFVATLPMVVPLTSGNVQLEWHHGRRVLELEFESPETIHYLKWDPDNEIEEEAVVALSHHEQVVDLIRWFMKEFFND